MSNFVEDNTPRRSLLLSCSFLAIAIRANMFRRFRFSLKWMLILFALLGVAFYLLFVRPTVIANQFVASVKSGDFNTMNAMFSPPVKFAHRPEEMTFNAVLRPRTLDDVFHLRREIELYLEYNSPGSGGNAAIALIVHLNGVTMPGGDPFLEP